jgi:hypothetical protein
LSSKSLGENYSPLYFLSALGAGGISISFFMYLTFLIPHKGSPVVTYNHIITQLSLSGVSSVFIFIALTAILYFAYLHFRFLVWNIQQYDYFKRSSFYQKLISSNAEISLMTIPLTLAMTMNVFFVLMVLFIPNFWSIIEYAFMISIVLYMVISFFAIRIFSNYFGNVVVNKTFDVTKNNNLSQMVSIFAFAMIGVGFAGFGAMSHTMVINVLGMFGAILFLAVSAILVLIKLTLGMREIFEQGMSIESSPTMWIMIPILTLIGITLIRLFFGSTHHFHADYSEFNIFMITSFILSLQILFGIIGYKIMKKMNYFKRFIFSRTKKSTASFALICPGVAFFVFGIFFINFGLVIPNIIDKYSIVYFGLMIPFIYIQAVTIVYFLKLKRKFFI